MTRLVVRAPAPSEWGQARVHVGEWAAGTRFHERALEILHEAFDSPAPEHEVLAAFEGATLRGVVAFGLVAGAEGTGRLLLLAADERSVGQRLADDAWIALRARGVRLVVAEVPCEPPHLQPAAWLPFAGWSEGGCVPDLVADGVDMLLLHRRP